MSQKRIALAQKIVDRGQLTPQGFLSVPANFTRTGVFLYRRNDGTIVRELRHPDDVFHPDSLASLRMAPLTDDHPAEFVTPENVKELAVGWIDSQVNQDSIFVSGHAVVADAKAIKKVDNGKKELSCGYVADCIEESGVYNGEKYDVRQTNIRYNHVAIVDRGRAGHSVRLKLDSLDSIEIEDSHINPEKEKTKMKKIIIDGKEVEVSDEAAAAYEAEKAKKAKDEEKLKEDHANALKGMVKKEDHDKVVADLATTKSEVETFKGKLDAANEKIKQHNDGDMQAKIDAAVKERMAVEKTAREVLGADAKLDGKSNIELMKETIVKHSPKADMKDKSEEYVKARFDSISEDLSGRTDRREQFAKKFEDKREDADFDSKAAREKAHKDSQNEWQQPLSTMKKD
jgi:hypothetical protein